MSYTSPAVVIDNGSQTTRAGFALEDLPSLVYSSVYLVDGNKVTVGDEELEAAPQNEVLTLVDDGLVYNWDNVIHNWQYAYDHLDSASPLDPREYPLTLTEQPWNTAKNKLAATQLAFETLQVPLFSLVKTPLAQLYHQGRSTGLVIDVGAAITSVTPILDGIIQTKAAFHSKYAGDFVSLHSVNFLSQNVPLLDHLLPKPFAPTAGRSATALSSSLKNFLVTQRVVEEFKSSMLAVLEYPLNPPPAPQHLQLPGKSFHVPYGQTIPVEIEQLTLVEPLFQPLSFGLPGVALPPPVFDKPQTQGLTHLILSLLKALEALVIPQLTLENTANTSANSSPHARFNDIVRELLSNILFTGGTTLTPGLTQRVLNDLYKSLNQFFPNYLYLQPGRLMMNTIGQPAGAVDWDRKFGSWLGACNLASMLNGDGDDNSANIALDNWFITKSDYEEMGEDLVLEKFK
jgi:actin-related protein